MKRIFVGIPILNFQFSISNFQFGNLRWIAPKNLHVTLVPPWYEENVEKIISSLEAVKSLPFELKLDQVTFGPNPNSPRLIWASGKAPKGLFDLIENLHGILDYDNLYGRTSYYNYKLHVTLARFRPEDYAKFRTKNLKENISWSQRVDCFVLYKSRLSSTGSDYEILKEYKI